MAAWSVVAELQGVCETLLCLSDFFRFRTLVSTLVETREQARCV